MGKRLSEDYLRGLVGEVFSFLTVLEYIGRKDFSGISRPVYVVECICGTTLETHLNRLTTGNTKSCGCKLTTKNHGVISIENHGMTGTPTYITWVNIRSRCGNKSNEKYRIYGERGIKVCEEWRSFSKFLLDMGEKPTAESTIERKDVNGDYCKENCIWTEDLSLQAFNTRISSRNTSGKTGVHMNKNGKWVATILSREDKRSLGTFDTFEEAVAARLEAEMLIFGFNKE